jgi:hypothetical protein
MAGMSEGRRVVQRDGEMMMCLLGEGSEAASRAARRRPRRGQDGTDEEATIGRFLIAKRRLDGLLAR